jgi:hypothetical protein
MDADFAKRFIVEEERLLCRHHATLPIKALVMGGKRSEMQIFAEIQGMGGGEDGRKCWKKLSGYHVDHL